MDCQTAKKWLSPYLDSELETAKTFEINEHLRGCEGCRRRFDAERQVDAMLRDRLCRETMPPETWQRLRREVNRSQLWGRLRVPAFVAAAACVMLAAFMYMGPGAGAGDVRHEVFAGQWQQYVNESIPTKNVLSEAEIGRALRDEFGLSISTAMEDTHRHPVQVIGARHVLFGSQPALEIRVNCCGRSAVITTLHQADAQKLPEGLRELARDAAGKSIQRDGVNVRVDSIGDAEYFIASEHYLDGLIGVMHDGDRA